MMRVIERRTKQFGHARVDDDEGLPGLSLDVEHFGDQHTGIGHKANDLAPTIQRSLANDVPVQRQAALAPGTPRRGDRRPAVRRPG